MKVEQKEHQEGEREALDLKILVLIDVEEEMPVDLAEAEQHADDLQIALILNVFVGDFIAALALLQAVVIFVEVADNLIEWLTAVNAHIIDACDLFFRRHYFSQL